jgi:peroxiredoxin
MHGSAVGLLVLLAALAGQTPERQRTPREQFEGMRKSFEEQARAIGAPARAAKTVDDRRAMAVEVWRKVDPLVPPFLDLAKKYPKDPVAVDILLYLVSLRRNAWDPRSPRLAAQSEAMDILVRDHVDDPKVAMLCLRVLFRDPSPLTDKFIPAVYERSKDHQVRGRACAALARYYVEEGRAVRKVNGVPPGGARWEDAFGKDYLEHLRRLDPGAMFLEAERNVQILGRDYGDVRDGLGKAPLVNQIRKTLDAALRVDVGKPAPEIEGEDADGRRFKLSEYRNNVVVLTFSGSWCSPCVAMYPEERELVTRFKGKPFALLSVVTDAQDDVRKATTAGDITWRCWCDYDVRGPIGTAWDVTTFPTIFVLDASGIIRYRGVRGRDLTNAIDLLLSEADGRQPAARQVGPQK